MKASEFFTEQQKKEIVEAIKLAEKETSGEIRVHVEKTCSKDILDKASQVFAKLKMHKTKLRNGVLFILCIEDHKFAVIGDAGINKVVPEGFWDCIKEAMRENFAEKKFAEGLVKAIIMVGEQLKSHFPYEYDDVNELPDDISFEK